MRLFAFVWRALPSLSTIAFLAACSTSPGTTPSAAQVQQQLGSHPRHALATGSPCIAITDSTGAPFTAARTGGGDNIDVEYTAHSCDIGIYISPTNGPTSLDHTVVNGPFRIGIYYDSTANTGTAHLDHTSICVNGTDSMGNCVSGGARSNGTGLDFRNTPNIQVDHTNIDGYAAGFATNPCPNPSNNINDDHTTITNSQFPWSFSGGRSKFMHAAPPPPSGGSCSGSMIGAGPPPYSLFGDAILVQPGNGSPNSVQAQYEPNQSQNAFGGVDFGFTMPLTVAQLTNLGTSYDLTQGTCIDGSPRFVIEVTATQSAVVYLGPQFPNPNTIPCAIGAYLNSGNVLTAPYMVDATQTGDGYETWAAFQTQHGTDPVLDIALVVDGFDPINGQTVLFDNTTINAQIWNF